MARYDEQVTLEDTSPEYAAFVEKFKPKKTTDDCYTPENVFRAVAVWACGEYGFSEDQIVRPFWPGGNYEHFDYPDGCVVLDNPPFSILQKILNFYNAHGIRFFLFAPALTVPLRDFRNCAVVTGSSVIYENGAEVKTSFITNMEPELVMRSAPALYAAIKAANDENLKGLRKQLQKYRYPFAVVTAALAQKYSAYGIDFRVRKSEAFFTRMLDMDRAAEKKGIFGGGLLLSERAAAERAAAERAAAERAAAELLTGKVWELSDREKEICRRLSGRD